MVDKVEKPMHLSELFRQGKMVEVLVGDPELGGQVFEIWMQKPSALQQEEAITKARAQGARLKLRFDKPNTDERVALKHRLASMHDRSSVIDEVVAFDRKKIRQQAMNDVLYGEVGSDWGDTGGQVYLDLLTAHVNRMEEITSWNEDAPEENRINQLEDEELNTIIAKLDQFETEVTDQEKALEEVERGKYRQLSLEELQDMVFEQTVDAEAAMAWYQEYRSDMLYYACRWPDDHKRLYFESSSDVLDLPAVVQNQLFNEFDMLDKGMEAAKNLLTPPLS